MKTVSNKRENAETHYEYKVEVWQYHVRIESWLFGSKKEAIDWLEDHGYMMMSQNGDCYIGVYREDGTEVDTVAERWDLV